MKIHFALDYLRNDSFSVMYLPSPLELGFRKGIDFALDKTKGFYHRNTELTHQSKEQQLI